MSDGKVEYEITGNASGLTNAAKSGEASLGKLAGAGRVMAAGLTAAIAGVTAAATGMGLAIRESANIETTETGIRTLVKDAALAKAIVQDLKKLGAETPFEVGDLAGVARQLLGAGTAVKDLRENILTLGDIAAGAQTPMNDLTQVINKVRGAGKLTGETFAQLSEKGIGGIREELAKVSGIPMEQLVDAISKGKVSAEQTFQAFRNLRSAGGLYYQAMIAQSATLEGRLSTLSDEFKALLRVPGDAGLGPAKQLVDTLIFGVQRATREGSVFVQTLQLAAANNKLGDFLGLSVNLGMRKAWTGFLSYVTGGGAGLRQAIAEEVGNGLAMAYNKVAGLLGKELMPVDSGSGVKAFFEAASKETAALEAEFGAFIQAGRLELEKGLADTAKTMKDAMSAGGQAVKAAAGDLKDAAGELKGAKEALRGDTDGDGIISKREQRKIDLEDKRAIRKANSLKGFSFANAGLGQFGGLDEFYANQFKDGEDGTGFEGRRAFSAFGDRRRGVASAAQVGRASRAFAQADDTRLPNRESAFRNIGRAVEAGVSTGQRPSDESRQALSLVNSILQELRRITTQ
jgi:tape measure domain-containing protein